MTRKLTVLGLAALVLLAGTAVASTAFTTATIDRDVNVDVNDDTSGVLQFAAGEGTTISGNQLAINADNEGLNVDSTFTYGDTANPTTTPAFSLTNNDGSARDITLNFSGSTGITFTVYADDGTEIGTFSDGGSVTVTSLGSGSTVYVTFSVTTGTTTGTDQISGTLTVSSP